MNTCLRLKYFGLLILLFNTTALLSQENPKVDSMVQRLEVVTGEEKFEVLKDIFTYFFDTDLNRAIVVANKAYDQASLLGDSVRIVRAGRMLGISLDRLGHIDEAISIYLKTISIAQRNNYDDLIKILYNNLGNTYIHSGQMDLALKYHFQTLEIRERQGLKDEMSITYNNLGTIYHNLSNYDKAKKYYLLSLRYKNEANVSYLLDDLLINIGLIYTCLNKIDSALYYTNLGLNTCNKNCSNSVLITGKFGLGEANYRLKKYELARKYYNESLDIAIKSGYKKYESQNLVHLANLSFVTGDSLSAIYYLNKVEKLLDKTGLNHTMIHIYNLYSKYYYHQKDFPKAAYYLHHYVELKDSLMGVNLAQNLAAIQSEYEQRAHNNAMAQKDELLRQQRYLTYAIGAIAVLVILVIFIFIRIYWLKIKQSQQQKLLQVEAQATERERENLAKELHDGVGTDLMATKLHVLSLLNQSAIPASAKQGIEEQFHSITKTVRNISYGLTPPGLDRFGLFNALSNYIRKINEYSDIVIHFSNSGADHKKGAATIATFRVLQELITNSLKHSFAKNIRITIESFDDLINILFEDDGKGFSPATVKRGLGLSNIESRVKSLGGSIALESGTLGTFYSIDIPLNNQ